MNQNDLAILIADCLKRGKRIYQGFVVGASNAGGKVQIQMSQSVPGFGTVVNATALNDCIGGTATAFLGDDGTWLALSSVSSNGLAVRQQTTFRRRRNKPVILLTHKLRVLVIVEENELNKIVLYAGSESLAVEKIWEDPTPNDDTYLLDSESYIRIDNKDIKEVDGWVVTGLWGDERPKNDGNDNRLRRETPCIAKCVDSSNYYENEVYELSSLKISGAYFYPLTYNSRLSLPLNTGRVEGFHIIDTQYDANGSFISEDEDISLEEAQTAHDVFGGSLVDSPPQEFINSFIGNVKRLPLTTTTHTGSLYNLPFLTGSSTRKVKYTFTKDVRLFAAQGGGREQRANYSASITGSLQSRTTQKFPYIYKGVLQETVSSETSTFSFDDAVNSIGFDRNIREVNFNNNSTANSAIPPTTVKMLPDGAEEETFSETYDYNLAESGELVSSTDDFGSGLTPTSFTTFNPNNQPNNIAYSKNNIISVSHNNPSSRLITGVENSFVPPLAQITSPNLTEIRKTLDHINLLTSSDGLNAIVKVYDVHERHTNVLETVNRPNRESGISVDNNILVRKKVRSYDKYLDGSYFYGLDEMSTGVSKQLIEFSGKKVIVYNYFEDFRNENPVNQNSVSSSVFANFNSFGSDRPPSNLALNQIVTFNSDTNSYHQRFTLNQILEFEYNNGTSQVCYGTAVTTAVRLNSVSFKITEIIEFSLQEKEEYDLEFLFGGQDYVNLTLQSLGGSILNYLGEYSSASNITISGDTAYKVDVISYNKLYTAQPYYVFLHSYKFESYSDGNSVYLKRQEPKFIECPSIEIDNLENVIFAYSD